MIINREELYETLKKICNGKYSIGLHGIDVHRYSYFYYDYSSEIEASKKACDSIMKNGLNVFSGRTINGTVSFGGRIDNREDMYKLFKKLTYYSYGTASHYIIVATPVEYINPMGEKLYVGYTDLDGKYHARKAGAGNEISTLLDYTILEENNFEYLVDKRFILGSFNVLENGKIDLNINEKHICFNGGVISKELFDEKKSNMKVCCIGKDFDFKQMNLILNILSGNTSISKIADMNLDVEDFVLETFYQLSKESSICDLTNGDLEKLQEFKNEYRKNINKDKDADSDFESIEQQIKNIVLMKLFV